MTATPAAPRPHSRRVVLIAGTGAAAIAACTPSAPDRGSALTRTPAAPSPPQVRGGVPLARLADVPVGGAVAATDPDGKPVVVAQPQPGVVAAFSAICTHQGCTVKPAGDRYACPCHGSVFDLAGGVVNGPAQRPLDTLDVHVAGDQVVTGRA